jgi:hypothetical protein
VDGNVFECEAAVSAESGETLSHHGGMILGEIDEHLAGVFHFEASEARRARGYGEGEIETEPGLSKLGLPGHEADGGATPERIDEPTFARRGLCEFRDPTDRQRFLAVKIARVVRMACPLFVPIVHG